MRRLGVPFQQPNTSVNMERAKQKLQNILEDGLGQDLKNAGRFCFSCEQIFADRRCLEEHVCSAASHICSCGTEFTEYNDMLEHSTTHEPGHQVLDHETIRKRRNEKRIAEEAQLKRLQTGEVVWKAPRLGSVPSISLPVKPITQVPLTSALRPQAPMQSALISPKSELYPSMSQATLVQNPVSSVTDMKNIFAGVGAPTVDLWTIYQPVVLVQTVRTFSKNKRFSCSKCGQCFTSKTDLISHHSSHVLFKVSGCIGCGLLLSSKKIVPRFHVCNSPSNTTKFKLITARPSGYKTQNEAGPVRSLNLAPQGQEVTSFLNFKSQNPSAGNIGSQTSLCNSTLHSKNLDMRKYSQSNQGLRVSPSQQFRRQNTNPAKPFVSLPSKTYSQNPSLSIKSSPSGQLKRHATFLLGVPSRPILTSSRPNEFTCRVCFVPFDTPQLLQRHKCVKAKEFMALRGSRKSHKLTRVTPVAGQRPVQMNGELKLGVPSSGNIKLHQVMAVNLEKAQGVASVNGGTDVDMDDDCYIVEKGPDKPAEMIYQVTSSVPIKT